MRDLVPIVWTASDLPFWSSRRLLGHLDLATGDKSVLCSCRGVELVFQPVQLLVGTPHEVRNLAVCSGCGTRYANVEGGRLLTDGV